MRRAAAILLIISALPLLAGDKKVTLGPLVKRDPQTAEIKDLQVPKPKQACPNWAWAAVVQLMLEKQNVTDYPQTYWVLKSAAGELCIESPIDLNQLKHWVEGDYILSDSSHVHFGGIVTPGAPQDVAHLVALLREGHPVMVIWQGRACVLKSIEYDEYIYPNNQRMFEARKLVLVDPLAKDPVLIDKTKDDLSQFGGVFELKVGPIDHFR